VSTAAVLVVAAVALSCPLHMLWRMRHGWHACCTPASRGEAVALRERQRALAERIQSVADSGASRESGPDRH
jgi:hypothetical protein